MNPQTSLKSQLLLKNLRVFYLTIRRFINSPKFKDNYIFSNSKLRRFKVILKTKGQFSLLDRPISVIVLILSKNNYQHRPLMELFNLQTKSLDNKVYFYLITSLQRLQQHLPQLNEKDQKSQPRSVHQTNLLNIASLNRLQLPKEVLMTPPL